MWRFCGSGVGQAGRAHIHRRHYHYHHHRRRHHSCYSSTAAALSAIVRTVGNTTKSSQCGAFAAAALSRLGVHTAFGSCLQRAPACNDSRAQERAAENKLASATSSRLPQLVICQPRLKLKRRSRTSGPKTSVWLGVHTALGSCLRRMPPCKTEKG